MPDVALLPPPVEIDARKAAAHARYLRRKARLHAAGVTSNGKPWVPRVRLTFAEAVRAAEQRFHEQVFRTSGCWAWAGGRNPYGYGKFTVAGRTITAHRIAYMLAVGPIPAGMLVCHRCDNPRCVRPDHLFLGTPADNMADKVAKGRQARGEALSAAVVASGAPQRSPRGSRHRLAKITEADVPTIRALHASGATLEAIGARFGLSKQAVLNIARRDTWKHVP